MSARTDSFERGMEGAQDSLNSVRNAAATASGGLQVLQGRADETGDELNRVDRQADDARRSFTLLTASTNGLSLSMGSFSSVLAATTIPALITLSTVAAPLAVVFGGIAAAAGSLVAVFGGLAATGVVTHMDELQSALQEAKTEILEIIQPLGEVFGPLLVDAVEALPDLVQAIVDSLGPMDQFRQTLINFGNAAMRLIPQITAGMFDLAEAALPALNQALTALESQGPGVFQDLQQVFNEVYPLVVSLGSAIAGILPDILELGTTVANLLLPALEDMIGVLDRVIARVNNLQPSAQRLVVSAVALAPVLSALTTILGGMSAPILAVVAAVGALAVAFKNDFGGIRTRVEELLPTMEELEGITTDAFETLETVVSDAAEFFSPITAELGDLASESESLGNTITSSLEPSFSSINTALSNSTDEFRAFTTTTRNLLRGYINYIESIFLPAVSFVFETVLAPIINSIVTSLAQNLGPVLDEISQTLSALGGYAQTTGNILINVWNQIDGVVVPVLNVIVDVLQVLITQLIDNLAQALMFVLNIIQGDFDDALNNLTNIFRNLASLIGDVGSALANVFQNAISGAVTYLTEDAEDDITNALNGFVGFVMDTLRDINLTAVISNAILDVKTYLEEDAEDDIKSALNGFADLVQNTIEAGINLGDAIANAIGDGVDYLTGTGEGSAIGDIRSAIDTFGEKFAAGVRGAIDLAATMGELLIDLKDYLTGTGRNSAIGDIRSGLTSLGSSIADALIDAVQNALYSLNISFEIPEQSIDLGRAGEVTVGGDTINLGLQAPSAQTGGFISEGGLARLHEGERVVPASQVTDRGKVEVNGGGPSEVKVVVEGDTGVIRDVSAEVVEDQNRRTRRNSGTTTSITR